MLRQQSRAPQAKVSLNEAEARAILAQEIPRRRKKQRLSHALGLGSLVGFIAACLLAGARVLPIQVMLVWQFINVGLNTARSFGAMPSTRQRDALTALLPYAHPEDALLLIEGIEYTDQPKALAAALEPLLPQVEAATLPAGARRLLRQQVLHVHAPLSFRQAALETLMRHPDPQTLKLVAKLSKTRAQVPGEEGRLRFAPYVAPPLPSPAQARQLLDQEAAHQDRLHRWCLWGKWVAFLGFLGAVASLLLLHVLWPFLIGLIGVGAGAIGTLIYACWAELPSYTRQAAYLSLLTEDAPEDTQRLLRHLPCLRSETHREQAEAVLQSRGERV